jgi:hypothetical protein
VEIDTKKFWVPKNGSSEAEYEDACSFAKSDGRFAVADGATEASFSGIWAKQLVRAFRKKELSVPITPAELKPLQEEWQKNVHRRPLPWFAEEKLNAGAFAAFVGLELLNDKIQAGTKRIWRATAAGDSCLVQIRGNEIFEVFPLTDSASFSNRPTLLCSVPSLNGHGEFVTSIGGTWGCDDVFFLMTDALACWFLRERERGSQPWNTLRDLDTNGQMSFEEFISKLRTNGHIKNDDVTLLRIDILA